VALSASARRRAARGPRGSFGDHPAEDDVGVWRDGTHERSSYRTQNLLASLLPLGTYSGW